MAKKGSRFFLDDESRKAVLGVADHHVPITDEGRRQAQLTGRALRSDFGAFDYVYHSGYRRTQETAEHLTTTEAEAAFPWLEGYWDTFGRFFARPPGGESLAEVAARVYLFLGMLFRDRPQQRILVVSHAGTLRVFRYLLERWSHDEFIERWESEHVPNCAVTSYVFDSTADRLQLQALNVVHWQR